MGPLLHPGLAFAGHWQLERCEEPSLAILRPYKLLPPISQVRSPLAAPCPQRGRRASSWSHYCSLMRRRAMRGQDRREMKEGWHMGQCHKNGMTLVAPHSQAHPGYLWGSRDPTSGISLTCQEIWGRAAVRVKPTLTHHRWGSAEEEAAASSPKTQQ